MTHAGAQGMKLERLFAAQLPKASPLWFAELYQNSSALEVPEVRRLIFTSNIFIINTQTKNTNKYNYH